MNSQKQRSSNDSNSNSKIINRKEVVYNNTLQDLKSICKSLTLWPQYVPQELRQILREAKNKGNE